MIPWYDRRIRKYISFRNRRTFGTLLKPWGTRVLTKVGSRLRGRNNEFTELLCYRPAKCSFSGRAKMRIGTEWICPKCINESYSPKWVATREVPRW